MDFEALIARRDGGVLFVDTAAPPMNLLGPELVRDLVSLIQRAEGDNAIKVLVYMSADPDYFIPRVDVNRISEYLQEAGRLTGESSEAALSEGVGSLAALHKAHEPLMRGAPGKSGKTHRDQLLPRVCLADVYRLLVKRSIPLSWHPRTPNAFASRRNPLKPDLQAPEAR